MDEEVFEKAKEEDMNKAWEATHNLIGVFSWLLEEDKKQHPENYIKK